MRMHRAAHTGSEATAHPGIKTELTVAMQPLTQCPHHRQRAAGIEIFRLSVKRQGGIYGVAFNGTRKISLHHSHLAFHSYFPEQFHAKRVGAAVEPGHCHGMLSLGPQPAGKSDKRCYTDTATYQHRPI